ncbi:MAG: FkbM family methyltransferase [Alphaproteobacteria bacterium]|nr:FkbM family methyltransferase [Alphaproteobacteria bacterium]
MERADWCSVSTTRWRTSASSPRSSAADTRRANLPSRRVSCAPATGCWNWAGVGFISAGVMRNVKPAYYAAVEADARLIPHIRETHARNGVSGLRSSMPPSPATGRAGEGAVAFTLHREFWRSGIGQDQPGSAETVSVPARDVSRFLADKDITVLIADIEGAELDLLRHIDTARLEKIVLELHPQRIGKAGVLEIFQILCTRGFAYSTALSEGSVVCFEAVPSQNAVIGEAACSAGNA